LRGGKLGTIGLFAIDGDRAAMTSSSSCFWSWRTGGRRKDFRAVQAAAAAGSALESQASASRVLQLEIEQTTQGQATVADT